MAGRPRKTDTDDNATRRALLAAASTCLTEKSADAISIREVAERANANSALISYYFGGKEGLIKALVDAAARPLLTLDLTTLKLLPAPQRTRIVVSRFIAIHHSNPWLPRLLVDVRVQAPSPLQEHFFKQVGTRMAKLLIGFVKLQQADGYFRDDIGARQIAALLLSQLAFPFVAQPLLGHTYHVRPAQLHRNKWIEQLCTLFESGCRK